MHIRTQYVHIHTYTVYVLVCCLCTQIFTTRMYTHNTDIHTHLLTHTHACTYTFTQFTHTHTEPQKQYDPAPHIVTIQHHHHRLWYASPGHRTPRSQPFPRPTRCPCSHFNSGKAHLCTQDGPRPTGFIWKQTVHANSRIAPCLLSFSSA